MKTNTLPKGQRYRLWWDGRTTNGEQSVPISAAVNGEFYNVVKTDRMCRNGRYVAALTIVDNENNEKSVIKPVVLFK
jgi:hypothetical protein